MAQHFVVRIHLHDRRYHGVGDWPPAPARVFQALIAGASARGRLDDDALTAFSWLERFAPPMIACPRARAGRRVDLFVPNNDADALGGELDRVAEIRAKKTVIPMLLESSDPFLYIWRLEPPGGPTNALLAVARDLYQLGRGVDMAWAVGETCDEEKVATLLREYRGVVYRPGPGTSTTMLPCPTAGSTASLERRHRAALARLRTNGGNGKTLFLQPPKPHFAMISYDAPAARRVYDLARSGGTLDAGLHPWPVWRAVRLVERIRDGAANRLRTAIPNSATLIDRWLVGRKRDDDDHASPSDRIRIVPLPSIGHTHADQAVRRVLVEVPPTSPLAAADATWAFSGLELHDPETGEVDPLVLCPSEGDHMIEHFVRPGRVWQTVTPAALPESARRRRIDPGRRREEAKPATERMDEERRAVAAVLVALRHAAVLGRALNVAVQREPFEPKGARAERFAALPRFPKERLWHVRVTFDRLVEGPLVIGDGRFLGLGVMAPVRDASGVTALSVIDGLATDADPGVVTNALRRAVMARVQEVLGRPALPAFFSGHAMAGAPVRSEDGGHLAFAFDAPRRRLLVIAPHVLSRRPMTFEDQEHLGKLATALQDFTSLRAGSAGILRLAPTDIDPATDPVFRPARTWRTVVAYAVNRHAKRVGPWEALANDLRDECARRNLPRPVVTVHAVTGVRGEGLVGDATIAFESAVSGPILLGRRRHLGGGLFAAVETESRSSVPVEAPGRSRSSNVGPRN